MGSRRLIYLDHAATSFPKPPTVIREVARCLAEYGGNAGRGAHALSLAAAEKLYECRTAAAALLGVSDPARVFFVMNTTHGINTVLKGLLREGDHVILSDMEHNAVLRPLYKMAEEGRITMDVFSSMVGDPRRTPEGICANIESLLRPETRLVICTHASNICSATMPIREIGAFCRQRGLYFVVDGAQSAGHEPIDVEKMGIDALCVPGHKGLLGPQGCGMVLLGEGIRLDTLTEGGNGMASLEGAMSEESPERYEAGTLPTPAIAGLCEGLRILSAVGVEEISYRQRSLYRMARERLGNTEGVTLYVPEYEGAILLFNVRGFLPEEIGRCLDEAGICVRSGYHCSALGHKTLGTEETGAVRISFGLYDHAQEVDRLWRVIQRLSRH